MSTHSRTLSLKGNTAFSFRGALAWVIMATVITPHLAFGQTNTIVWNAGAAKLAGNGCAPGSVALIATGNDLTILFSELGVDLPQGIAQPQTDTKNCNIIVPATVSRGVYLAELTQRLNYSIQKTARSRGWIATQSVFFGHGLKPLRRDHLENAVISPAEDVNIAIANTFAVNTPGWCGQGGPIAGQFISKLRTHGQKHGANEGFILVANDYDVRFEVSTAFRFCPQ